MSDEFERLKTSQVTPEQLRKTVRNLQGITADVELDPTRGVETVVGERRWTFVMTKEAVKHWKRLGTQTVTLGVLGYHHSGLDYPYVQRVLVALPGKQGKVKLEMRDSQGRVLWTGSGTLQDDELDFSMPITRQRVATKGMVAGRLDVKGNLTLTDGRLPKPTKKQTPTFESED